MEEPVPAVGYLRLVEPWIVGDQRVLARTSLFTLREHRATSPRRSSIGGRFVYLDCGDWVNVIAITADDEVVLIEQFRHGRAEVTLEIPGGMVDGGEDVVAAGLRELREETGFVGARAEIIGKVSPNPALLNNMCYTLLVHDAAPKAKRALDSHEEIAVRVEPLAAVPSLISDGIIHHALVVAAFHHLTVRPVEPRG